MEERDNLQSTPPNNPSSSKLQVQVLLIDDTKVLLDLTTQVLQLMDFDVTSAYGGKQGLEALKAKHFDIVLCDYQMTHMNGVELTKHFREWEAINRPGNRQMIYGLTAYPSTEVRGKCEQAGMQGVLTKPLEIDSIMQLVREESSQSTLCRHVMTVATTQPQQPQNGV